MAKAPAAEDAATTSRSDLPIRGMTCASCASRIERGLSDLPGVEDAHVNFATEIATVLYDATATEPNEFRARVSELGYSVATPEPVGHDRGPDHMHMHGDDDVANLRLRLIVAAVLSVPLLLISMVPALMFDGWEWVALVVSTPVIFWAGWSFHRATLVNLRHRAVTMDTLVSLGTTAAWLWSFVALVILGEGAVYFETAAVIITLLLLGKLFEARARRSGERCAHRVAAPGREDRDARGRRGGADRAPGGRRPLRRAARGEDRDRRARRRTAPPPSTSRCSPVSRCPSTSSRATRCSAPPSTRRAGSWWKPRRSGARPRSRRSRDWSRRPKAREAPVQRLADRISSVFVPIVIVIALATLAVWLLAGYPADQAFSAAVAVLIIACPCALGLATPTAIMVGTGRGAQLGIVIKGGEVLEATRRVDVAVLDKTGTITSGRMALVDAVVAPGEDEAQVLRLSGSAEDASEHPIARAIAAGLRARSVELTTPERFVNEPGLGVSRTRRWDRRARRPARVGGHRQIRS